MLSKSNRLKSFLALFSHPWSVPLALLVLCLISYLPAIDGLGFYWDDWPSAWFLHNWGPASYLSGFAEDRPLLAWVWMLTTSIIGGAPSAESAAFKWQLFGILARWLSALGLWWTLCGLWPRHKAEVTGVSFLYAIYPGFSQQYIAMTYSNAFLLFGIFIASLGAMIYAFKKRALRWQSLPQQSLPRQRDWFWPLYFLSLLLAGGSLFISEYFFGLELLRPILLWMVFGRGPESEHSSLQPDQPAAAPKAQFVARIRRVLLWWLPYLLLMILFIAWHTLLQNTPRAKVVIFERLAFNPLGALLWMILTIAQDFYEVNFLAWLRTLDFTRLAEFAPGVTQKYILIVLVCAFLTFIYLWRLKSNQPAPAAQTSDSKENTSGQSPPAQESPRAWARQAVILGFITCLLAGWPIWITNLHFELLFPWDRFTLMTMMGTCIMLAGLIGLLGGPERPGIRRLLGVVLLTLLVSLSAGAQYLHRQDYRQDWLAQKNFFWQMVWRMPALQPGTVLLTSELPFTYYSDNSLTAPLNWIYADAERGYQMRYAVYNLESRLGASLKSLEPGTPIEYSYRIASFTGSTSQAVLLFYDPPRCVKVVDPSIDRFLPVKPLHVNEALPLSRLDLISSDSSTAEKSLQTLLGPEPEHAWCYYFEKADLYRQTGEWDKVVAAADKALRIKKDFTDKNISELLPFIEGYAHTGDWKKAVELSLKTYQTWDKMQYILCDVWSKIAVTTRPDAQGQEAIREMWSQFQCPLPQP